MRKLMLSILLLSGNIFAMDNKKLSQKDKECCELVSQALLQAHIGLRFKADADFPKRNAQAVMHGNIPATFTTEKSYLCGAFKDDYYLKDKPKTGDMIVVVPSMKDKQGSVTVNLERADFDSLGEELYNNRMKSRLEIIELIFNYYNID